MKTHLIVLLAGLLLWTAFAFAEGKDEDSAQGPRAVHVANLIYAKNKTSVCFSSKFLTQAEKDTRVRTYKKLTPVRCNTVELFQYPFAVMTGEGAFVLTKSERDNLRNYLQNGGFIVASAGCGSKPWNVSLRREIKKIFPDLTLERLPIEHPVFHTVYDLSSRKHNRGNKRRIELFGLEIDGKIVLIHSSDGLNDTANVDIDSCCCCGGNEVKAAKKINVNLLAYALTN